MCGNSPRVTNSSERQAEVETDCEIITRGVPTTTPGYEIDTGTGTNHYIHCQ